MTLPSARRPPDSPSCRAQVSLDPSYAVSLTESRRAMLAALFTSRADDGGGVTPGGGKAPPKPFARGASWAKILKQTFLVRRGSVEAEEDSGPPKPGARRVSFSEAASADAPGGP